MSMINRDTLREWRHEFHRQPETAFEEHRTSARIAEILESLGIEKVTGLGGGTGVVAWVDGRHGGDRAIGLRADIDALDVTEANDFAHASQHRGKMHACGHDGHTTMLLGAACALAENPDFAGRVYLIFQPAEENEGGGRVMVEEGLFERFPMEAVYGVHNWPGMAVGEAAVHDTAVMAAFDAFSVKLSGNGCHAAMPHLGTDVVLAACQLVNQLQGIISRETPAHQTAVMSVTQFHAGDAFNVMPETVTLCGTVRCFDADLRDYLETRFRQAIAAMASFHGLEASIDYQSRYPATFNTPSHANRCAEVLEAMPDIRQVHRDLPPSMASEDFAFMLQERPGAYIWLGNGKDSAALHNPHYDFNDELTPIGVAYWTALVRTLLSGR
ncbi:M20 family metallopeptidase [Halomonas sp. McH1-25]|uniref:M20 aminoacylase family protein n=1 Tax=unclassified Halomonas TaxID=2609666 RepID=UPI001EF5B05A|nr:MULTISPECIES: M20 aminoacylase family protein [unclassified Halomonas]MCG7600463.1 M20 family metallopeptidase [Halomonas sp. McH1-25]MCP1342938.1 M20 family metallopeptidase [Halomonas sp. FL8]MCP1359970.1 M20 family metallopeptidase [Halomonas sp. BBD45]